VKTGIDFVVAPRSWPISSHSSRDEVFLDAAGSCGIQTRPDHVRLRKWGPPVLDVLVVCKLGEDEDRATVHERGDGNVSTQRGRQRGRHPAAFPTKLPGTWTG